MRGLRHKLLLESSLPSPPGWGSWYHKFTGNTNDISYTGPIVFDDWNKSFKLINPDTAEMLDRISVVNRDYQVGILEDPHPLFSFRR